MKVGFFTRAHLVSPQADAVYEGVKAAGDDPFLTADIEADCDVAFHTSGYAGSPRKGYLDAARKRLTERFGKRRLVLESPCFREGMAAGSCWRLSLGGFLYDEADYANENSPSDRWEQIQEDHGITLLPYRDAAEGPIIVCLQKQSDASLRGRDTHAWGAEVEKKLRAMYPGVEVILRKHPLDGGKANEPLRKALKRCRACVTYTSLSAIESICAGVPTVAMNSGSLAWPVTYHRLEDLGENEPPPVASEATRDQWLADLAYCQWTLKEIREGEPWNRLRARLM